jgi:hypothetical protein
MPSLPTSRIHRTSILNSSKVQDSVIIHLRTLISLADPEWTKEETDHLFNLIREYDSRFYIVNDRYDFPGGPPRSMEASYSKIMAFLSTKGSPQDLKDRYYSVCRKLIRNMPWAGDEAGKSQLVSNLQFDKGASLHFPMPPC